MKKPNWQKIVDVEQSVLATETIGAGYFKRSAKLLGKDFSFNGYYYIDGSICRDKNEIISFNKSVMKDYKKYIPYLFSKIKGLCTDYLDYCKKLKIDFINKSNKEVAEIFLQYIDELEKVMVTLNIPFQIEIVVTKLLEERLEAHPNLKGKADNIFRAFNALTLSTQESDVILEKKALLEFAMKVNSSKQLSELFKKIPKSIIDELKNNYKDIYRNLESIYERFTYTYFVFMVGRFKTLEEYVQIIGELTKKEPKKELDKIKMQRKYELKKLYETIDELDIEGDFLEIVNFAREVVYLRTYRLDRIDEGIFMVYPLFKDIAKRLNIDEGLLLELKSNEIIDALNKKLKINLQEIKDRKNGFGYISFNKKVNFYFGKEFDKIKDKEIKIKSSIAKGRTAFPGRVTGKVALIKSRDDLGKVKEGDILVTKMTTPDYIKDMEKSAAIVTEIGGITTHAAILSRELGKPCIIGTGNATSVFKDGDIVEVDANKGIVKKINK